MSKYPASEAPTGLVIVLVVFSLFLASLVAPATTTVAQSSIPVSTPPVTAPAPTPEPTAPVAAPTPYPPSSPPIVVPETREQQLAEELLANEPGVYGFVVMAADGSLVASINGQTPFVTASLYKLILMADIYQRIEMGNLASDQLLVLQPRTYLESLDNYFSPDQVGMAFPLQEYLFAVGAYSSNVAARTLLDLTSREALRNTAMAIGMMDTYLFTDPVLIPNWRTEPGPDAPPEEFAVAQTYLQESARSGPTNVTTPLDMARYGIAIANDTLLSPWVSEQVANVLLDQAIRDRIPALLEGDVLTINKPGNLPDAVNDVGVLYLPDGPRAVATLSLAVPNTDRATEIEQQLAVIATGWASRPPLVTPWREDA